MLKTFLKALGCALFSATLPTLAAAQYFGQNVVRYHDFDFEVMVTEHFDIYYYDDWAEDAELIGQLAERWYARLRELFDHDLTRRQPLILYASHPHFRQTNTTLGQIGEATGGFTEIFRNRVVMPFGISLGDTDHVLGHELVHAFQFDLTGRRADPERFGNIPGAIHLPLWLVEGMAEYLSLGPYDSHTAMWLRDLVLHKEALEPRDLQRIGFQPYRHGHALMAYIGGRFGDEAVGRLLVEAAGHRQRDRADRRDRLETAFERVLDIELKQLIEDWLEDAREQLEPLLEHAVPLSETGRVLRPGRDNRVPNISLGPALSPDGNYLVFLGRPDRLRMELYLMDVESGEIIRRITRFAVDPHVEALQFVRSAGDWHPDGVQFVYAAIARGQPVLEILDVHQGESVARHFIDEVDEILNPVWSPDGKQIAFTGMLGGRTDLYLFDTASHQLQRLTNDRYSVLQPAWSPDGQSIVFVTDRFGSNGEPAPRQQELARLDLAAGTTHRLPGIAGARHGNPVYSADGQAIYFVADARGTGNVYRLILAEEQIEELTNVETGVAGLTPGSPALSVAGPDDNLVLTALDGGGFALVLMERAREAQVRTLDEVDHGPHLARLPPAERIEQKVVAYLDDPRFGLPADPAEEVHPYEVELRPEYVSQVTIGAGSGPMGTFIGGGFSMWWSDMLGDHNLLTQLHTAYFDGEILNNTAAVLGYQNRARRLNWGVIGSQIPLISGQVGLGMGVIDDEPVLIEQAVRFWEINRSLGGSIAYPFNRATRVEFGGGVRHISFDARLRTRAISLVTGDVLISERRDLPMPDSIMMGTAQVALVHDTSVFGGTAPALGYRARLEVGGTSGDLQMFTPLVDLRGYWMPFEELPLTVAARMMHFGRYGPDADDRRLRPLFLGGHNLVRGYDPTFTLLIDPVFERMQGSRIAVGNVELRIPLTGVRGLLGAELGPPIDINPFFDAGWAWDSDTRPRWLGGQRGGITSYGVSLRMGLGRFFVLQLNWVNPRQFEQQDWHLQFGLAGGF